MALTAEQITVIRAGMDTSAFQVGANLAAAALKKLAESGEPVIQQGERLKKNVIESGAAFERFALQTDKVAQATATFVRIQTAASTAVEFGRTTAERANQVLDFHRQRLGLVTAEEIKRAAGIAATTQRITEQREAIQRAAQAQQDWNRWAGAQVRPQVANPGVSDFSSGLARAGRQDDLTAFARSLDAVEAKISPLLRILSQYRQSLDDIAEAESLSADAATQSAHARQQAMEQLVQSLAANRRFLETYRSSTATGQPGQSVMDQALNQGLGRIAAQYDPIAEKELKLSEFTKQLAADAKLLGMTWEEVSAATARFRASLGILTEAEIKARDEAKELKADQEAAKQAFDLRSSVEPSFAVLEEYRKHIADVGEAIRTNLIRDPAQANAAISRFTQSTRDKLAGDQQFMDTYRPGSGSAVEDEAFAKGLANMRAQLVPAARETQQLNEYTNQLAVAVRRGAVSWTEAQAELARYRAGLKSATEDDKLFAMSNDEVREKTDAVFRASKIYEAQFNLLQEAQRRGLVVGAAYDRELDALNASFKRTTEAMAKHSLGVNDLSNAMKLGRVAFEQFGIQGVDIIQGFASGQPVFRTLVQQLGQIGQVMLVQMGFTNGLKAAWAALTSTTGLMVVGMVAVAAAMATVMTIAESLDRRLEGTRTRLAGVTDEWNKMADAQEKAGRIAARSGQLSTAQAQAGAGKLFGTGEFLGDPKQAAEVLETFERFSRTMGDAEINWERMGQAMRDPAALLQTLLDDNHLKGINPELIRYVRNLQESSNRTEAFAEALRIIRNASSAANDNLTPLEQSLIKLRQALAGGKEGGEGLAAALGRPLNASFAHLIDNITNLVIALGKIGDVLSHLVPQWMIDYIEWSKKQTPSDHPPGLIGQIRQMANSDSLPSAAPGVMADVIQNAARQGIDPTLLSRLQRSEGVFKNGQWQDSPTGPIGPMQMARGTFEGVARQHPELNLTDIRDPAQNIAAGSAHFGDLLAKYGNVRTAILAYHDGEPTVDAILAKGGTPGSKDAIDQANRITAGYAGPASGLIGARGGAPSYPGGMPTESTLASRAGGVSGTGFQADVRDAMKAEEEYRRAINSTGDQITELLNKQQSLTKARDEASKAGDAAGYERIGKELEALQGQLYGVLTPQQALRRQLELQNDKTNEVTEGSRKMREVMEQLNELDRQHPETSSAEVRGKIIQEVLRGMSQEYKTLRHDIDEQIAAQDRLGDGYQKSYTQAQIAEARTKALADAQRLFPENTEAQKAALDDLTASYLRLTRTTQDTQQAQQHLVDTDTLTYTQRETQLITESDAARAYHLKLLQDELEIRRRLASASPAAVQQALNDAQKQANAELERTSAGYRVFIRNAETATEQQGRLATATSKGYREAEVMTARIKAENDAFNLFPDRTSPAYLRAVDNMTAANLRLADSIQRVQAQNEGLQNADTQAFHNRELSSLGQEGLVRDRILGQLKNEMDVKRQYKGLGDEVIAARLKERNAILDQEIELKRLQGALDEVASSISSSFDTVGNAITQALVSGQGAAVNWKNVMNSVAQQVLQQFLKLAVLNPLLNELFGGTHRSTLGDVFDALRAKEGGSLGSLESGSQSVSQEGGMGGSGAVGILGTVAGLAGKLFGFFGGGGAAGGLGASQSPFGDTGTWDSVGSTTQSATASITPLERDFVSNVLPTYGVTDFNPSSASDMAALRSATGGASWDSWDTLRGAAAGMRHAGGVIGFDPPAAYRYISDRVMASAPRFHTGLNSDEFAAILQKGERVLTAQQDRAVSAIVGTAANDSGAGPAPVIQFNITTPDADSFRRSQTQIMGQAASALMQTRRRLGQR